MAKEIIKFSENIYGIREGFVTAHLVIGDEYALLFDTGIEPDLKETVNELTDLPVKVYHTHTDGDHVAADSEFEKVYMHPSEYDYARKQNIADIEAVWEGEVIKAGEYRFKAILIPGHTPGSLAYLDEEKGIMFPGDFIPENGEEFMCGPGRNFEAYKESLNKINAIRDKIKILYQPHGTGTTDISIIDDYLKLVSLIDEGNLDGEEVEMFGHKAIKYSYKRAVILLG